MADHSPSTALGGQRRIRVDQRDQVVESLYPRPAGIEGGILGGLVEDVMGGLAQLEREPDVALQRDETSRCPPADNGALDPWSERGARQDQSRDRDAPLVGQPSKELADIAPHTSEARVTPQAASVEKYPGHHQKEPMARRSSALGRKRPLGHRSFNPEARTGATRVASTH
jgi:hypothetical protein